MSRRRRGRRFTSLPVGWKLDSQHGLHSQRSVDAHPGSFPGEGGGRGGLASVSERDANTGTDEVFLFSKQRRPKAAGLYISFYELK